MSKRLSKAASLELTFLAALDRVHANVDISEISEIQDWSRAVRGKLYGASIKRTSHSSIPQASVPPAIVTDASSPSKTVPGASGKVASHDSGQYFQMAIPQLIAECTSESSLEAWSEFIRRSQPLITTVITKAVRRFRNVSHDLVDDLIQDVYLRLCADNFRALRNAEILHENSFFGFLKVVAANTIQNYFRTTAAFDMSAGGALEADRVFAKHELSRGASNELERTILLAEIDTILKTLSHEPNFERDRAIFWLYYRNGLTAKAISASPDVELTVKGVESILHRLTRHIRAALLRDKESS